MKASNIAAQCAIMKLPEKKVLKTIKDPFMKVLFIHAPNVIIKQQPKAVSKGIKDMFMKV